MNWFYVHDNQSIGPIDEAQFQTLVSSGQITSTTLVWHEGLAQWQIYDTLKTQENSNAAPQRHYAGFWIRLVAVLLDGFILNFIGFLLFSPFLPDFTTFNPSNPDFFLKLMPTILIQIIVGMTISACYETVFIGKYAATPGKMLCQLRVIVSDGSRVSYLRAFGRYNAKVLSQLVLNIGYLMVAFTKEKRGLHDMLCDTRVVYK